MMIAFDMGSVLILIKSNHTDDVKSHSYLQAWALYELINLISCCIFAPDMIKIGLYLSELVQSKTIGRFPSLYIACHHFAVKLFISRK